jgi:hypothetical protein
MRDGSRRTPPRHQVEQAQDELDRGERIPAAEFLADLRARRG